MRKKKLKLNEKLKLKKLVRKNCTSAAQRVSVSLLSLRNTKQYWRNLTVYTSVLYIN